MGRSRTSAAPSSVCATGPAPAVCGRTWTTRSWARASRSASCRGCTRWARCPLSAVSLDLGADVVAVVRETLSNVARHAGATTARVDIGVGARVEVRVADDGVGPPPAGLRSSGLANLAERAVAGGGAMDMGAGELGGTLVRWSVPLPGPTSTR